ncbi:MAG: hypothetical protein NC489_32260 [Ruminococcus flavefaciens]|nr:hypothetical protein [Ruminococcus flavefaciens]
MARPILNKISPFDATKDYEITLSWLGSRAHANRIIICDNETNAVVFDDMVSSFSLKHTIPAYTLRNNKKYTIQAQIYDVENIPSVLSNKVLFYTFATPDFYFEDLSDQSIISTSSFAATIHYYSEDWEEISKYNFYLYDASKKQLLESSEMTDNEDISYIYKGLDNNTVYYIRCVGVTVNGMELDTGYIEITVRYENPNTYARIYATPLPSQGCIQVATNLVIIQYNGTDEFKYIDGMIDLREKTLYYDKGFLIENDFTVLIRGINLWQTADLFKMSNGNYGLTLSSRIYNNGKLRFRLMVPNGIGNYLLYSDEQVFDNEDMVTIAIRRKNNVYQLKIFVELGFSTNNGNVWYGSTRPSQSQTNNYDNWIHTDEKIHMINHDAFIERFQKDEPQDAELNDLWIGGD